MSDTYADGDSLEGYSTCSSTLLDSSWFKEEAMIGDSQFASRPKVDAAAVETKGSDDEPVVVFSNAIVSFGS